MSYFRSPPPQNSTFYLCSFTVEKQPPPRVEVVQPAGPQPYDCRVGNLWLKVTKLSFA